MTEDSTQPIRCVIYARFSPRPDAENATSIGAQVDACRRYADSAGWDVLGQFHDAERSGADHERPNLWRAIKAVPKNGVLLVFKLDRMARDVHLAATIERELQDRGARVVSTQGEGTLEASPEAELIRHILHAHNQYHRKVQAFRTSIGMKHRQNVLRQAMGSKPPYGFCFALGQGLTARGKPRRVLVEDTQEQAVLRDMVAMRAEGLRTFEIVRELNSTGRTARGQRWRAKSVDRILRRQEEYAA